MNQKGKACVIGLVMLPLVWREIALAPSGAGLIFGKFAGSNSHRKIAILRQICAIS